MLWIHPVIQILATILGLWVMHMGWRRYLFAHCKVKCFFNWKAHVKYGKIVFALWIIGLILGLWMTKSQWGMMGVTGPHYTIGLIMAPMAIFGYLSGWYLDKHKGKRFWLPVLHGVNNALLLALALYQIWSGYGVIRLFMLP